MSEKSGPGVKVFSIAGRMKEQRERCLGMTEEERKWRAQYLKDQILDPEEPKFVPEYYKLTNNIFRRIWQYPMRKFEAILTNMIGAEPAYHVRHIVGKTGLVIAFAYVFTYYAKYHKFDFTKSRGLDIQIGRPRLLPGDPGFDDVELEKDPMTWADDGFLNSPLAVKIEIPPPPAEIPPPRVKEGGGICEPPSKE